MAKQNGVRIPAPKRLDDFPLPGNRPLEWDGSEIDQFAYNQPDITGEHSGHIHWTIQAYMLKTPQGGLVDVVPIAVEAPDVYAALHRAREIFPLAKFYRVGNVNEACTLTDGLRKE